MKNMIFVLMIMFSSSALCDEVVPEKTEEFVQKTDTIYRMPELVVRNYQSLYDDLKPLPQKPIKKKEVRK
jgi:hypothetical protein